MTTNYLTDGCLVIDNSSLSVVKTCPTMARYKLLKKRVKVVESAKGRGPGKALHYALEQLYRASLGGPVGVEARTAMQAALNESYADLQLAEGDDYLHLGRMTEVLGMYLDGCRFAMGKDGKNGVYQFAGWGSGEPFEVLGVEVPMAVRLGEVKGVPVIYIGRSDLVVRFRERGEVMCVDHKSARRWTGSDSAHWRRDAGLMGYAACVPQWVSEGIDKLPHGVRTAMEIHEPLREQLSKAGVGGRPLAGYMVNAIVMRDSTDLTRCKEPPTAFHRELYYHDDTALAGWRENTLAWCEMWLERCEKGMWPENTTNCTRFFGGMCSYLDVCSLPPGQRAIMLETDAYEDSTWSPIARDTDN